MRVVGNGTVVSVRLVSNGRELASASGSSGRRGDSSDCEIARLRCRVIDSCREAIALANRRRLEAAQRIIDGVNREIQSSSERQDERVVALRRDVTGRITKALDGMPRWKRWGCHYLRSLLRAHALQQATNELDYGLQMYCGELFNHLRQKGKRLFLSIPPPTPPLPTCPICCQSFSRETIEHHAARCMGGFGGGGYTSRSSARRGRNSRRSPVAAPAPAPVPAPAPAPAPVSMSRYTSGAGGGGCFGGDSTVVVVGEGGVTEKVVVSSVVAGDNLLCSGNSVARVRCVVRTRRMDPFPLVAIPNGPKLTPKHPIKIHGEWVMSNGHGPRVEAGEDGIVFNFVLDDPSASLLVDGFECVTLGHGLKGSVVGHSFYGTERVLEALRELSGWGKGSVVIDSIVRNEEGHAVAFRGFEERVVSE